MLGEEVKSLEFQEVIKRTVLPGILNSTYLKFRCKQISLYLFHKFLWINKKIFIAKISIYQIKIHSTKHPKAALIGQNA